MEKKIERGVHAADFKVGQEVCILAVKMFSGVKDEGLLNAVVSKAGRVYITVTVNETGVQYRFREITGEEPYLSEHEGYDRYERKLFPSRAAAEAYYESKNILDWFKNEFPKMGCSLEQLRAAKGILEGKKTINRFGVKSTYSFADGTVFTFPTYEEAAAFLRRTYEVETASDREMGNEFESEFAPDGTYAKIINYRRSGEVDTSEWELVDVEEGPDVDPEPEPPIDLTEVVEAMFSDIRLGRKAAASEHGFRMESDYFDIARAKVEEEARSISASLIQRVTNGEKKDVRLELHVVDGLGANEETYFHQIDDLSADDAMVLTDTAKSKVLAELEAVAEKLRKVS